MAGVERLKGDVEFVMKKVRKITVEGRYISVSEATTTKSPRLEDVEKLGGA